MSEAIVFSSKHLLREIYSHVDVLTCGSHRRICKVCRDTIDELKNWEDLLKKENPEARNYVNVPWGKYYYAHANHKRAIAFSSVFSSEDLLREIYSHVDVPPKICASHRRVNKAFRIVIDELKNWENLLKKENPKTRNYVNVRWSEYYYAYANYKKSVKCALFKLDSLEKKQFMDVSEYQTLISGAINSQRNVSASGFLPTAKHACVNNFFNLFRSIEAEPAIPLTEKQAEKIFADLSKLEKKDKLKKNATLDAQQIEVKFYLALCRQFGIGTKHSPYKAMQYYKQISKSSPKHFAAFLIQSVQDFIKASGETFNPLSFKNKERTIYHPYLDLVVRYGTSVHKFFISIMYENGVPGVYKADPKETFKYCVSAAENAKDYPDLKFIQHYLGMLYQSGLGTEKNPKMALNCFLDAANHGFAVAQYQVAALYEEQGNHQQASVYFKAWHAVRDIQVLQIKPMPQSV